MTKTKTPKRSTYRCKFSRIGRSLRDVEHVFEARDEDELEHKVGMFCFPHLSTWNFTINVDLEEGRGTIEHGQRVDARYGDFTIERASIAAAPSQRAKRVMPYHKWKPRPDLGAPGVNVSVCTVCGDLRREMSGAGCRRSGISLKYVARDGDGTPQWQATRCRRSAPGAVSEVARG